ncbi:hypothetical protein F4680DRAFT_134175 [Xylaria scruposa]|nr:hypothetical protein F4680DRAFT_134175 [Xylaria scruposa]
MWVPLHDGSFAVARIGSYETSRPGATVMWDSHCSLSGNSSISYRRARCNAPRLRHPVTSCTILGSRASSINTALPTNCSDLHAKVVPRVGISPKSIVHPFVSVRNFRFLLSNCVLSTYQAGTCSLSCVYLIVISFGVLDRRLGYPDLTVALRAADRSIRQPQSRLPLKSPPKLSCIPTIHR